MTKTFEQAEWRKGKRPLVKKYQAESKAVEEAVAGRGFLCRPGYLAQALTAVERDFKSGLSDLNYEITREAIERELKQTGFDYDIAYKEARISWELEKAQLLTALEQEFADNKYNRVLESAELDRLEITTNLRKLVIMAAKTAIDEDMEELRQEMTRVEGSTFDAENALLSAKLLTAQKKLTVIPYIEAVLEKQQSIIDAEGNNAALKGALISRNEDLNDKRKDLAAARALIAGEIVDLIAAKRSLVEKKQNLVAANGLIAAQEGVNVGYLNQYISALSGLSTVQQSLVTAKKALIPYINDKSTALISYAAELDAWVAVKESIAEYREMIAQYDVARAGNKQGVMAETVALNNLNVALREAEISLKIAALTGKSNILTQKTANAVELLTARQNAFDDRLSRESELTGKEIEIDLYQADSAYETMKEVNDTEIEAQVDSLVRIVMARIQEREGTAAAAAGANLTSKLTHLLS